MISYKDGNKRFNYRVVGVCIHNQQVLLHRQVTDDSWALPGGRAELLECSPDTLRREMDEELGVAVTVDRLLYVVENFFELNNESWHELGLYYLFDFPSGHEYYSLHEFRGFEDDGRLVFKWHPVSELSNVRLLPEFLRDSLQELPKVPVHILYQ